MTNPTLAYQRPMYPELSHHSEPTSRVCTGTPQRIPMGTPLEVLADTGHDFRVLCAAQYQGATYYGWLDPWMLQEAE